MKALVCGGSGFLGGYVVDELLSRGHEVTVFDLRPSPWLKGRGRMVEGSILDAAAVRAAAEGNEAVYNFAGLADLNASIDAPLRTIELNVMGNLNVLEACRAADVGRFIYASSVYVFSHRGAFYGASKKASELIVEQYQEQYGLDYTIVRYGSVYGERADATNRIYRILREALTTGRIVFAGDGLEEREYIHGRDAAKLSVDVLDPQYRNQNVMLTGSERFQYRELLLFIREMLQDRIELEFLSEDYKGHYRLTPYSFVPRVGVKLMNNPCIDFGQGLLECIDRLYSDLRAEEETAPEMQE